MCVLMVLNYKQSANIQYIFSINSLSTSLIDTAILAIMSLTFYIRLLIYTINLRYFSINILQRPIQILFT